MLVRHDYEVLLLVLCVLHQDQHIANEMKLLDDPCGKEKIQKLQIFYISKTNK